MKKSVNEISKENEKKRKREELIQCSIKLSKKLDDQFEKETIERRSWRKGLSLLKK